MGRWAERRGHSSVATGRATDGSAAVPTGTGLRANTVSMARDLRRTVSGRRSPRASSAAAIGGDGDGQAGGDGGGVGQRGAGGPGDAEGGLGHRPDGAGVDGQVSGPQQLGDRLERDLPDEAGDVVAPVGEVAVGDVGEPGREDDVDGTGSLGAGAGAPTSSETVDLVGLEPRGAAVVADGAVQQPTADVGVDRRPLDAEAGGHLIRGEQVASHQH